MSYVIPENKPLYLRVSGLAQYCFCPRRSKIQLFNNPIVSIKDKGAVSKGIRLHQQYERMMCNVGFDRTLVKYKLGWTPLKVFEKQVKDTNIIIRGIPDDLRVIINKKDNTKRTVLLELKTTSRKMIKREIYCAMKQLQLYMWLLKEKLEDIGFPLWKYGIVEIYSQTGELIKRYSVEYDEYIEDWIKYVVKTFIGEQPLKIPYNTNYCRKCPEAIREKCSWYEMMKHGENSVNM
jgi:hypothetical protein